MIKLSKTDQNLKDFIVGYVNCLYWLEDSGERKSDEKLSTESFINCVLECTEFLNRAFEYIIEETETNVDLRLFNGIPEDRFKQAGHDFYLTRNGHGTGFWDKPEIYGETGAEVLTKICKNFGEVYLYVSDDGEIEIM